MISQASVYTDVTIIYLMSAPVICVILGGIITALVFWQSSPRPAKLVLAAMLLLAAINVGERLVQAQLLAARAASGGDNHQAIFLVFTGFSVLRAVVYGLLFAAVFIGRRPPEALPSSTASPIPPMRIL